MSSDDDAPTIGDVVDDRALGDLGRDDIGNAERFIARVGVDFRETQRVGRHGWDGKRWALDDGDVLVMLAAQRVARAIRDEAKAFDEELKTAGDDDYLKDAVKHHRAWARQSANAARLNAMVSQAMPHLAHPLEGWNANAELLCLPDGVLDLTTMEPRLRPHRREDYMTRMAAAGFDPQAPAPPLAPNWRAFVERVLPDPEIRAFVQRCVGSCLVDSVSDQVMIVFHGGGANGKSTFLDVVADVMGELAMSVSVTSFLANDRSSGSAPQPDIVRLAYRPRMVRTSEPPPGARLAEGIIKEITGGEPMVVRDLHEKPIEFRPNFKVFLSCNNRPSVRGGDDGIWRRIRLVPWSVQIPPEERDPKLRDKLIAERDGIFAWLLEGWADWRERGGLEAPAAVLDASEEYRTESDAVGRFLVEWCVKGEGREVSATLLHDAFEAWSKAEGMDAIGGNIFGRRLTDRGYGKRKSNGITYRTGLDLTEEARTTAYEREADRVSRGRKAAVEP